VATPKQNSPEILCAEILADARRQSEEIIQRAKQEAEALIAKATTEADRTKRERLEAARAEALRRRELIFATVPVEAARLRSARVEAVLESVREDVVRLLLAREGFDYRETVISLAAEAMKRMPGSTFIVKLSVADCAALGNELAGEIAQRVGRSPLNVTISKDSAAKDGVLVIQDLEGRLMWNNGLSARLDRLWPELRRQIAIQTSLVLESKPGGGGA
jgi:vacuolar-type H+-ATPase subunit E/Vma4